MKVYQYTCILLGCLLFAAQASPVPEPEPEPEPKPVVVKGRRSGYFNEPAAGAGAGGAAIQFRSANGGSDVQLVAADETEKVDTKLQVAANGNKDASSGRLFLKKFMLFKNMFSGNNKQPVIIVTGPGTGTATTDPVTTVTSTGTIPSATGTISTSPITTPTTSLSTPSTQTPISRTNEEAQEEPVVLDEEALQAALANGAQEYVVSDPEEIQGTGDAGAETSKASRQPARINLRRRGTRRGQGQTISVRIPPRYRRYFKNGQKVVLNTNNNKRRVVKKRVVKKGRRGNKNRKNKNKRTRITAA